MAKVISTDTQPQSINTSYSLWRIAIIGLILGFIYWGLTALLEQYTNSLGISGNIATIIVATLGIIAMVRLQLVQPLIVAIVSGATLWGMAEWTNGLVMVEIVIWSMLLYGLTYVLFSWIARYAKPIPVLTVIMIIVIVARIASTL